MKILGFEIKKRSKIEKWIDTQWVETGFPGQSPIRVSGESQAMKIAAVYRCSFILGGIIASLPLEVKRKKNGFFVTDEDDPLNYLLNVTANGRMNSFEFMRNTVIRMLNAGNAYIYPEWYNGEITELILLSPHTCTYDSFTNTYTVSDTINGISGTFDSDRIIHIKNLSLDGGYTGVSVIRYAANVLNIQAAADGQALDVYQPGSTYRGFVSGDDLGVKGMGRMQDKQLKTAAEKIESELNANRRILSMPSGMQFHQLSMSPADLQLLDSRRFGVLEICRFYGVHPDLVFAGQSNNYKASEMSQSTFITDTLSVFLRQLECELRSKLIPRALIPKKKIEFDQSPLHTAGLQTEAAYMKETIQSGVMTVNEWRKKKGMPPVEGGDTPFMSCNTAPINSAKIKGENVAPKNDNSQVI